MTYHTSNQRSHPHRRLKSVLKFLLLGSLLASALWADAPADALIQKLETRYNGIHSLSAKFVESYSIQGHPRPNESGTLTLRKQGKMRWEYVHPAGKLFISDGKSVFLVSSGDSRVERVPLKETEDMRAPLSFLLGHLDMKRDFRDFKVRPGEGGAWLDATAKNSHAPYEGVSMLISGAGSVAVLKVMERDTSVLTYSFSDEILNPPVPDRIFSFRVRPDQEVLDPMQTGSGEK